MSGNGVKKVAEVAAKATKSIDWDGMAKALVSDEARKEFANLRRAFDEVNSQLQTKFSQVQDSLSPESHSSPSAAGSRFSSCSFFFSFLQSAMFFWSCSIFLFLMLLRDV